MCNRCVIVIFSYAIVSIRFFVSVVWFSFGEVALAVKKSVVQDS